MENQFKWKRYTSPTYRHDSDAREALATQNLPHNNENEETASDKKDPLKDRLFIDLNVDTRKGRVKFDNEVFEARLVDLPCIIESLKTTDKKTFYKV